MAVNPMKILVVDDEGIVLNSCRLVLEAEHFEVCPVLTADDALEALKGDGFTLLVIDVKMPGHDGMYLMREVKKQWPDIPVIIMSGYHTPETIREATEMGAATFIAKPFTPDELIEVVRQVLKREGCHGEKDGPGHR